MWLLAMGGVSPGAVERPVYHVDLSATAADLLGIKVAEISGKPIREIVP
jgi:arylsulfatase A-like enzyme